ncbi:PAS domain-containing sensor histidine kinase [Algoriphagus antarcticus]|uniref:histidine kinase n=1 Tax=Algoriphagus antarcticus TaxID=238540 RepID=A0A3E0DW45_9BACT|nr:PAS domain S-box protein [Algoriphagus antarcticus]REG87045.1 PAS domain S-box-containing protein [Algoriphagus antarcticus]
MSLPKKENSNNICPTSFSYMNLSESGKGIFELIENISGIGFWKVNLQTGENQWSDKFYKICGLDRKKNPPSTDLGISVIHPEDRNNVREALEESIEKGIPYQVEKRILWPSGEIRHVLSEGVIEYDEKGKPHFLIGTFKDITNLKGRESQYVTTSSELGDILDYSIDLIFLFDANGLIAKVSESVLETLGYSKKELLGKHYVDFLYPPDLEKTNVAFKSVLQGEKIRNFEIRLIASSGNLIHLNWSGNIKQGTNQVLGIARDVTELVELRKKQIEEKFRIQTILNSSPDLIWSLDRDFKLVTANNAFFKNMQKALHWDIKSGENLLSNEFYEPKQIEFWKFNYEKALKGKNVKIEVKEESKHQDFSTFFETKITPIEVNGEIVGLACFSRDVTEKRIASEKIKVEIMQLHKGQEISKIGYWESDLDTKRVFWSDEMYKIWEVKKSSQNLDFDFFFQSIHPEDRKEFLYHKNRALIQEKKLDVVYRIILEGNRFKYIHEKGEIIQDKNGKINLFRGTAQEITKEKEIEIELRDRNFFIESTLNNIPMGIAVNKISDGEATYMNKAFEDIYGWPKSELVSVNDFFENVYPNPEYRNWIKTKISEDVKSGVPERMSWKGIKINTKDGKEKIVNAKNIPVPDLNLMISTVSDDTDRYLAEQALKVSNDRFTLASEAVSDAIWDWDLEKDTIFLGQGFQRLFGYPVNQNQVDGKLWSNNIHPDNFEEIQTSIQKAIQDASQKYWSGEYRFRKNDGFYAFVIEKSIIIRNKKGVAVRIVGAIQDITQEKEREKHLNLLESVVTNTTDSILITKAEPSEKGHEIIYCNKAFIEMTGYQPEEVLGKTPKILHGIGSDQDALKRLGKNLRNWESTSVEVINYRKDGTPFWVNITVIPVADEKGWYTHWIGIQRDVTERKKKEQEVELTNENLKKANRELLLSNQDLEQFAYVASHDLQEPLRMISSFLGLIEKRYDAVLDEKGKKYIHFAIDGANRMREIILDLLEFSKLDSFKEAKSWVESKEILDTSLLFLKKNIDKTGPVFHLEHLPKVYGHKSTLIQLFQNIISNAIKYQPEGQKPEIWITGIECDNEWEFSIKDNGIGIEQEYLEKIFVIFQRLHVKGTYTGTGIGLAISKKIIDLHEGRIWAESELGEGTNFYFTLKKPASS